MLSSRTDLLNYLIERYGLKSYCEIGLQNAANNFDKIKCRIKTSVDPDPLAKAFFDCSSDDFFRVNHTIFDLYLVDGLHHAEQVKKDFENALQCLSDKGFIVLHDCLPTEEQYTKVPRETKIWYGDVYKFAMTLQEYAGINFVTWDNDCGCCVIWKDFGRSVTPTKIESTWKMYQLFGKQVLNVINDITSALP